MIHDSRRTSLCLLLALVLLAVGGTAYAATTELVSTTTAHEPLYDDCVAAAVSADGRFVVFQIPREDSPPFGCALFIRDRRSGTTDSLYLSTRGAKPALSPDARYVSFYSRSALASPDGDDTPDVYVLDRDSSTIDLISQSTTGEKGNGWSASPTALSADGTYVLFYSGANNLVAGDTNDAEDAFVRNRIAGTTELVSISSSGEQGDNNSIVWSGALSADGRYVAFLSCASNLAAGGSNSQNHAFIHDRGTGTTTCIDNPASGRVYALALSADGTCAVFASDAPDLVPGDTNGACDVFVCDLTSGVLERVSVSTEGAEADGACGNPAINADGRYVVFCSAASNLVPGDTNATEDLFLHDRQTHETKRVSVASAGGQASGPSGTWPYGPSISADGRFIAYDSYAVDLAPGDANPHADVFLWDRDGLSDVAPGYWAYRHILACFHAGIVSGYADGRYLPLDSVTRAQMAVYIARAVAGGEGLVPPGSGAVAFPDVPNDYWAYDHIEFIRLHYIVTGYPDGGYHPEEPVTRDQMAVYVARSIADPTGDEGLIGYLPPADPTYSDVPLDQWARRYIEYCSEHGIVQGYADGAYHPTEQVTRDQMAVYIARAFQLPL